MNTLACEDSPVYEYEQAAWDVEQAVLKAGCLKIGGGYVFAAGDPASRKIDMEELHHHPRELAVVRSYLLGYPCLHSADVLLAVPEGAQNLFGEYLSRELDVPWARLERIPGGSRYDFRFISETDRLLAEQAKRPRIVEDVVRTLGSVAHVAKLLDPIRQDIHTVGVWNRGHPKPEYQVGLTEHYLVERFIPLD